MISVLDSRACRYTQIESCQNWGGLEEKDLSNICLDHRLQNKDVWFNNIDKE